ncbi:C6 finger domain protein [Mycena sanguinolenta]|uniref:C6 finger domain protein n=2 Tax=Mycena sanguinolenta TaxID=230812 RepID=A0A8H6Z661_9AGAR|nr:C6 finger domain protein [Mycena sanguinolenta]
MSTTTPKRSRELKQTSSQFSTRKKSCLKCAEAKARCNLQRPVCSRCQGRGIQCHWFTPAPETGLPSASAAAPDVFTPLDRPDASTSASPTMTAVEELSNSIVTPGSTGISSAPPILESIRIGSRWMDALLPPPGRIAKKFSPHAVQYMSRVLKSYPKALVRDDDTLPPILHPFQSPAPQQLLVNCRTLLRMWENRAPGSEVLVRETIQREMSRVFQEHHSYDHITLLSACQAYLLYSIYLFFCTDSDTSALVDTATMINLQELASSMSLRLYPCDAESAAEPPDWDAWIVAEAKRRTLYTMYTFDHVHNYLHDTTSYIGTELGHLPLPAAKGLWAATTASAWRAEYARFSAEWPTSPLLEDLWPDPEERVVRRERADRWVESADEFGMFMFAIANVTFDL